MKPILKRLAIVLAVILVALITLLFGVMYWTVPTATVRNESATSVQVVAQWRDKHRDLGLIRQGQTVVFKVPGEGGISFTATYPDGSQASSTQAYYTATFKVLAVVRDDYSVAIDYVD